MLKLLLLKVLDMRLSEAVLLFFLCCLSLLKLFVLIVEN